MLIRFCTTPPLLLLVLFPPPRRLEEEEAAAAEPEPSRMWTLTDGLVVLEDDMGSVLVQCSLGCTEGWKRGGHALSNSTSPQD